MNFSKRIVSLVLTIFLFVGLFSPIASAASREVKLGIAFVTASSLRLRSQPNTTSATLDFAPNGEVVVVISQHGEWYKVIYNLNIGYMHKNYLKFSSKENAELGYGAINGSGVNIRKGPTTSDSILRKAYTGHKAYILGMNQGWYKVIFEDVIGYVRSDYLDLTEIPYENQNSSQQPLFYIGGKSTGLSPSAQALQESTQSIRQKILATAKKYLGVPYLWGGTTPSGFDCSGYVQYIFRMHGVQLPRTSKEQWTVGTEISKSQISPGDLVFFANTYTTGVSHLGIYIGDGQFIHASSSQGVTISSLNNSYWASHYFGSRRID